MGMVSQMQEIHGSLACSCVCTLACCVVPVWVFTAACKPKTLLQQASMRQYRLCAAACHASSQL